MWGSAGIRAAGDRDAGCASGVGGRRENVKPLRVLFANEPRSFREVFAEVFRVLRPGIDVREALPENLDAEVKRLAPDLVFCSGITPFVERSVPAWVDLYPPHEPVAMIYTAGELSTVTDVDLNTMLSVVDRTQELLGDPERPSNGPGGAYPERAARRREGGPGTEGGTEVPAKYDPLVQCGGEPGVEHWDF